MSREEQERWDSRYVHDERWRVDHPPFPWLVEHIKPVHDGLALDLACGLGHNTLWLAEHGYWAIGVDVSLVALRRGLSTARSQRIDGRVMFAQVDLDHFWMPPDSFDLICVIRFLNRAIFPTIASALKPGGQLLYATLNWRYAETSPDTPTVYLLSPGELECAFSSLNIIDAHECDDMSYLIAQKSTWANTTSQ